MLQLILKTGGFFNGLPERSLVGTGQAGSPLCEDS